MFQQELDTRLFTDFRDTRDIIRLIPHEGLKINELSWREAHLFHEIVRRKGLKLSHTFLGNLNYRMLIRQLDQILISANDSHIEGILLSQTA